MVKNHAIRKNIIILIIYLFSITNVLCKFEWLTFDFSKRSVEQRYDSTDIINSFALDFTAQPNQIPYYVKVQVTSHNGPAPLLCFSTTDQNCNEKENIAKNPTDSTTYFWARREQFERDDQELYFTVECVSESMCSYTVTVTGDQAAVFPLNFAYSYLVVAKNKEMKFEIQGKEQEEDAYLTIAIEGSAKAKLTIENNYEEVHEFNYGKAVTFKLPTNPEEDKNKTRVFATVTVKGGEVEDYITLTSHVTRNTKLLEGVVEDKVLVPNGPEFTSVLDIHIRREECFTIDLSKPEYSNHGKLLITGLIYTKYAWFFLEDEKRQYLEETDTEIIDGQLYYIANNTKKVMYVCLELPSEETFSQDQMVYSISVSEPLRLADYPLFYYYKPQITGTIQTRIIPKGTVAYFSSTKSDSSAKKYEFSTYNINGLTKMYIGQCTRYPKCNYAPSDLQKLTQPKSTNEMTIWVTDRDRSSTLGREKYVIVVYCEDDDNNNSGYCSFQTSFFSKGQETILVEDQKFSKFVQKGEKGIFKADLQTGRQVQRLIFDIMIFSGDVSFEIKDKINTKDQQGSGSKVSGEDIQISYDKYYLANKVFYHINLAQLKIPMVTVEYNATLNSFFTIQYNLNSYNKDQLEETIPSGESYLVEIDPISLTKSKKLNIYNQYYKNKNPFLVNFYELNCQFRVARDSKEIIFADGYAQEVIESPNKDKFEYIIYIQQADISNYNHKMCMIYVAGYEAETKVDRDIVVGENIPQQIIFNKNLKKIRFLYPHADTKKDLTVHVNVIDQAYYKIRIFGDRKEITNCTLTRTETIYLRDTDVLEACKENSLCPIIVYAEFSQDIVRTDPMLEITIREVKNTPTYIQKGQAKLDYVCGDNFYYLYTDIGKNENGEITLNFLREFGTIWGKIVRKNEVMKEPEANWRGMYRMPSQDWEDSLPYNGYTKKLIISSEDTRDCIDGCYLLLSIQIDQIGEYVEGDKFYPFSIITKISPNRGAYSDIPKVVIQVDEFVVGNVNPSKNERISEFYEIWLPHDSKRVDIDFQSSIANLYINVGGLRPTTRNADFEFVNEGKDAIYTLKREDILDAARAAGEKDVNSLEDVNLVIGIWTDKTDSGDTELYSLRIHQAEDEDNSEIDINEIKTDQKILCKPNFIGDNQYRCLFMVTYDDNDVELLTPIFAYAESSDKGALTYMYGDFIERYLFDEYYTDQLRTKIPTSQTAKFNTRKEGVDYIYLSYLKEQKYMYINVISDKPDDIMIVTSMPVFNLISFNLFSYYPNPNTEQLLNVPGAELNIAFPGDSSVMVNIVTLAGHAELSWKSDPSTTFIVRGFGDRISLSSGKKNDELVIKRIFENDDQKKEPVLGDKAVEDPGFAFYISYTVKDIKVKYDEISYGKSLQISYKDIDDLPVYLYSKINTTEYRDINVAITFRDNANENMGELSSNSFIIASQVIKKSTLYNAKKDINLEPPSVRDIKGNYDPALKTAQIFLSEDVIKGFYIRQFDLPTVYIKVNKNATQIEKKYEKFDIEAQVSGVNDGVMPVEKIYHYGRVGNNRWEYTYYRLKPDIKRPYMRIQIAFNGDNLDFFISDRFNDNRRANISDIKGRKEYGKIYVTFKTDPTVEIYYLNIFKKSTVSEEHLNNFAFKFINAEKESNLFDYPILTSPEIEVTEKGDKENYEITCTFNRLNVDKSTVNITYFFKVVENSTHIYGEEYNTIAVTESPYYTTFVRNPTADKITLVAKGKLSNWVYLNVIAQVQQNNIVEYTSYNGKKLVRPNLNPSNGENGSGGSNVGLFVAIGVVLFLIVIALVVAIIVFQIRNQKLMNQVKHVSFQNTNTNANANVDPNLLLQQGKINN